MTTATSSHHTAADKHWDRRHNLLRQARQFDIRTMHLEPYRSQRTAIIRQAEDAQRMAMALDGEMSA